MKTEISYFRTFHHAPETVPLLSILKGIKQSKTIMQQVVECRYWVSRNKPRYDELKKKLAGFTVTGTFESKRTSNHIAEYTGYVVVDYDHIATPLLSYYKDKIIRNRWVLSCFVSPSAKGLKVIIPTSNKVVENHQHAVAHCFDKLKESGIDIKPDKSGTDIARLCFISHDNETYINPTCDTLYVPPPIRIKRAPTVHTFNTPDLCTIETFTNRVTQCIVGNRNNYVFRFALNARQQGIDIDTTTRFLLKHEEQDFHQTEIIKTIQSAYKR